MPTAPAPAVWNDPQGLIRCLANSSSSRSLE
ncbi:hypothetical protein FNP_1848 [Fusobacterium polymorphum ATCC 10953]|uniref:Uncharacterized protein n=1 Tax=Fusobacterium polymorphum ATCC 10953 TaxID=393480 RepID=A5TXJ5_FUSNP|nr:hypothetical protein FNP_1848 [Fusobacterium polymorphum ATCC 10953]